MDKQQLSVQILDVKSRRDKHGIQSFEIFREIDRLESLAGTWSGSDGFLGDFVPIRLVTYLEVVVREKVRELVDHGEPYASKSITHCRSVKFDFILASSLAGKLFTIGDIVSHSIPVNDISQIISIFITLIGDKFKADLGAVKDRWEVEINNSDTGPIVDDVGAVVGTLGELFGARHIVTHEHPSKKPFSSQDLHRYIQATRKFLSALEVVVTAELYGNYPLTQADMNAAAHADASAAEKEMNEIIDKISGLSDVDKEKFKVSQQAWEAYCDAESRLHASLVEGGSMWPLLYSSTKAELIRERSTRLKWWVERQEGEL